MNNSNNFLGKNEIKNSVPGVNQDNVNPTDTPVKHYTTYEDPTGEFGQKEFKWALWYVKNKFIVRKWIIGIIIGVNVLLWLPSLFSWINYLVVGIKRDDNLARQLTQFPDYTVLHARYGAASLQISSPNVFLGGVKKYDLSAEVTNPNARFIVAFDYYFLIDGTSTPKQTALFLAGESRPLAFFGYESDSDPGVADLMIENMRWQRIDSHTIPDSMEWQAARLNFTVTDVVFIPAVSGEVSAGVVRFNLANESPYGFVEPDFYVAFLQGGDLTGLMPLRLSRFKSMEKRAIDIRTFADNVSASEIKIYPLINLYDSSEYIVPPR